MADRFVRDKKYAKSPGYSKLDPGASVDSGFSNSSNGRGIYASLLGSSTAVENTRERISVSWENVDVFVEIPGPSLLRRLCFGAAKHEKPTGKQVLFNGRYTCRMRRKIYIVANFQLFLIEFLVYNHCSSRSFPARYFGLNLLIFKLGETGIVNVDQC